jgi:hypothetical protein
MCRMVVLYRGSIIPNFLSKTPQKSSVFLITDFEKVFFQKAVIMPLGSQNSDLLRRSEGGNLATHHLQQVNSIGAIDIVRPFVLLKSKSSGPS